MVDENEPEPDERIVETVRMENDGSLELGYLHFSKEISPCIKQWHAAPGSHDFIDFGTRHGVTKPGQQSVFTRDLRNGVWTEKMEREGTNW